MNFANLRNPDNVGAPPRRMRTERVGSLMIEAVVACVLLAAALLALSKLSNSAARVDRSADVVMSLKMTVDNFVQRTRDLDDKELGEQASQVASALSAETGHQLVVNVQPQDSEDFKGIHLLVTATSQGQSVTIHDWRLETERAQ